MRRILIAVIALSLCAGAADAAAEQKHKPARHDAPAVELQVISKSPLSLVVYEEAEK